MSLTYDETYQAVKDALQDYMDEQRTRADAAEAQRDRLAGALRRLHDAIDDFNAGSEKDDDARQHLCWLCGASTYGGDGVIHEPHCAILPARAALADVPDALARQVEDG